MWSDPESGSQIEFDSFVHLARTAERGLFDFFFLAEGLRLREHRGRIHDLDVVGRPDTFTVLAALAGVTERLGLAGTVNTTFNEPFEVARQFATLDHLSDGRAGWNMVTSSDAFTGENFRRGGFLDHADRYRRAEEFITVARDVLGQLGAPMPCWPTRDSGIYVDPDRIRAVEHHGPAVRCPRCRDAARRRRRAIRCCCRPATPPTGGPSAPNTPTRCSPCTPRWKPVSSYYADVKGRAASYGRDPDRLKVFPAATFVLGDTPAGGRRQGPPHPATAGQPADRDRDARAGLAARPVGLRPGRSAARRGAGRRPDHHAGPGPPRRPEGRRRRVARARARPRT